LLSTNVVSLRRTREISQKALAFEAGLRRTFVAQVERQTRSISVDNIEMLAVALRVEPLPTGCSANLSNRPPFRNLRLALRVA
jgi:transcriptional regulator with XRE-family HTH domain